MKFLLIRFDFEMEVKETKMVESETFPEEDFDNFCDENMTGSPGEQFIALNEDELDKINELFNK